MYMLTCTTRLTGATRLSSEVIIRCIINYLTHAFVLNQTTENFQEMSSLVTYKFKLNKNQYESVYFCMVILIHGPHMQIYRVKTFLWKVTDEKLLLVTWLLWKFSFGDYSFPRTLGWNRLIFIMLEKLCIMVMVWVRFWQEHLLVLG